MINENLPLTEPGESIEAFNLSIFFNNIDGYLSKRATFLNTFIPQEFNVVILQETNIKENHVNYDDFSIVNKLGKNLHVADNSYFSRGTLIAWDAEIVDMVELKPASASGHEIAVVELSSKIDTVTVIVPYRSPSMNKERTEDFFIALEETISQAKGKILVCGDLNIMRGRKLHHDSDEGMFIDRILRLGVRSIINEITHPSHNNQLDYCFTNIDTNGIQACTLDATQSDHLAFDIRIKIVLEVIITSDSCVTIRGSVSDFSFNEVIRVGAQAIISANVPLDDKLAEMEIFLWEMKQSLFKRKIFRSHRRVRNCTRQISRTILDQSLDHKTKRSVIRQQQHMEAKRKINLNMAHKSGASRIMACYNLGAKGKQVVKCNLDPNEFKDDILQDEQCLRHEEHVNDLGKWSNLLEPLSPDKIEYGIKKLKAKWKIGGMKIGFCEAFWRHIAAKIGSSDDTGTYSFARVEPVMKDKSKYQERKGWRLVWKATSYCEKAYDLFRSLMVKSELLVNDAYCQDRSTHRALTKVSSWDMSKDEGLLGCDYMNAFARVCRPCVNELLGCEFINPEIEFQVVTNLGSSDYAISRNGTGAGRATGGPAFNVAFHHMVSSNPTLKELLRFLAPYADDSNQKTSTKVSTVKSIIEGFDTGQDVGLFMHKEGKKRPTLLVRGSEIVPVRERFEQENFTGVSVVGEVKFLGMDIFICEKYDAITAKFPSAVQKLMSFFIGQLTGTYRIAAFGTSRLLMRKSFFAASEAIASTIESRIQYIICYADTETICNAFNIHRRAICAITGKSFRFFGFKNMWVKKSHSVHELYDTIDQRSSNTYRKLCKALGRPTMLQMALRASTVIERQCNFSELAITTSNRSLRPRDSKFVAKIKNFLAACADRDITNCKPRLDHHYCDFAKLDTFQKRRNYLKALTDNLCLAHLESKGWARPDMTCRFKDCTNNKEDLAHLIDKHMNIGLLPPGVRRDLNRMRRIEENMGKKRVGLDPSSESAVELAHIYGNIGEPYLKIQKRTTL